MNSKIQLYAYIKESIEFQSIICLYDYGFGLLLNFLVNYKLHPPILIIFYFYQDIVSNFVFIFNSSHLINFYYQCTPSIHIMPLNPIKRRSFATENRSLMS